MRRKQEASRASGIQGEKGQKEGRRGWRKSARTGTHRDEGEPSPEQPEE